MKKRLSFLLFLTFSFVFCQINIDEIKKNVTENPQKFYYENLEIFKSNPQKLTQEQLNYIYYGNNYVGYGYNRSVFNKEVDAVLKYKNRKISEKLAKSILPKALQFYEQKPLDKSLLMLLSDVYRKIGDETKSELYFQQYSKLIETIQKSGNGFLEENAVLVTSFQDQMFAVENFSKIWAPGIDFKSKVLPDGSWLWIYKNGMDLFFVRTFNHKDMFKDDQKKC